MMQPPPRSTAQRRSGLTPFPCACANLRRAERIVTQIYDAALHPAGLRITQFTLLRVLLGHPGVSQKHLAGIMDMDSTTLTRTLGLLRRKGWVRSAAGQDRREIQISLTPAGKLKLHKVIPAWDAAQAKLKKNLGATAWKRMQDTLLRLAQAARQTG